MKPTGSLLPLFLLLGLVSLGGGCWASTPTPESARPIAWAQAVRGVSLGNFYQVDKDLYRSQMPEEKDIETLQSAGIRTVIRLRSGGERMTPILDKAGFVTHHYPMEAGKVDSQDLVAVLRLMRASPKPVLIHCRHGADRTGFIVAGYRMAVQGWTSTEAIEELRHGGYGFHEALFGNIIDELNRLDVNAVRKAVTTPEE